MNKYEINEFIEKMEELGDIWEPEDVERCYGDWPLQDALDDRRSDIMWFGGIIGTIMNG